MIQRIVLVKLSDAFANDEGRAEIADYTRRTMPNVPGVRSVQVGVPADERVAASWDLSIVIRVDRLEDVEVFRNDPVHRSYVDDYLRPKMACIKAWNFQTNA